MKCFVKGISLLLVALLYIVSTMGYGVHKCTAEGTSSVILMFGEAPCEFAHSHEDGEHHEHHHHSGNCCSTSVYVVSEDQDTVQNINLSLPVSCYLSVRECICPTIGVTGVYANLSPLSFHGGGGGSGSLHTLFCMFRV